MFSQEISPDSLHRIEQYVKFLKVFDDQLGPIGDYTKGEVQIVLDPDEIHQLEMDKEQQLIRRGVNLQDAKRWSQVGVIDSGSSWILIRDPVILPSGRKTTRHRISWKTAINGPSGVAMLPVTKEKKILLCVRYKHALRTWQVELPRGKLRYGETEEVASQRELQSEIGFTLNSQVHLGGVTEGHTFGNITPVFLCNVESQVSPCNNDYRAIIGVLHLTKKEIKEAFVRGFIQLKIKQEVKKVSFNDSCLAFALMQAEIRGLV